MKARTIARMVSVALMGLAVLVATGDGFAQSYAGLYGWAIEHGLKGWKADGFPLMVDLFIGVGELGLFLLAIDGHRLRKAAMPWLDLIVPAAVAASGWSASLIFNVGHTRHIFSFQATAAVPPLASMIGLLVLLRTLHRYVAQAEGSTMVEPVVLPVAAELSPGLEIRHGVADLELSDALDGTPPALLAWLKGEPVPEAEERVPAVPGGVPVDPDPHLVAAAGVFAEEVRRGEVPSVRAIKKRLRIGTDKAGGVRVYLADLARTRAVPEVR